MEVLMTNRPSLFLLYALASVGATMLPVSAAAASTMPFDKWHLAPSADSRLVHIDACNPFSAGQFCVTGHCHRLTQPHDQPAAVVYDTQQRLIEQMALAARNCRTGWRQPDCVGDLKSVTRWMTVANQ
jgi:hypothetical protein